MTPQEKLAEMRQISDQAERMRATAGNNSTALYNAAQHAERAFNPLCGVAYRISLWYNDPDVGADLREVAQQLAAFDRRWKDWCWSNASLAEMRAINENERQYRLEERR